MELHPALEGVKWLLGTWRGSGKGVYPTIAEFTYEEELRFWHAGKPVMAYSSRTWSPDDGRALHAEMGYWRPQQDGSIEVVIAHSFGLAETMHGHQNAQRVHLESDSLQPTPTAKAVQAEERTLTLEGDELRYEMSMAFGDNALQNHLTAALRRIAEPS
ncbi:MAG TPA: FABP family protein [Actinomycetota bacterium]|nr:FABP family protein [Actinomycetota bacterium]